MTKVATNTSTSKNVAKAKANAKTKRSNATAESGKGSGGPQRILDVMLAIETKTSDPNVPRKMVCAQAGVKPNTFNVAISLMKNKEGLIDYDKDTMRFTDKGRARAVPVEMPLDNKAAQEEIMKRNKLSGDDMPAKAFRILLDGRAHDRADLAAAIGCTNKNTYAVMLSNLKKKDVIVYDRKTVQLSDACFPYGRPS